MSRGKRKKEKNIKIEGAEVEDRHEIKKERRWREIK